MPVRLDRRTQIQTTAAYTVGEFGTW
jgi:hypothetical protein